MIGFILFKHVYATLSNLGDLMWFRIKIEWCFCDNDMKWECKQCYNFVCFFCFIDKFSLHSEKKCLTFGDNDRFDMPFVLHVLSKCSATHSANNSNVYNRTEFVLNF